MWAWQMMMMMLAAAVVSKGVTGLPTLTTNDRPIIGILTQELLDPLVDGVLQSLGENIRVENVASNHERANKVRRHVENMERMQHPSEELEGISRTLEEKKEQKVAELDVTIEQDLPSSIPDTSESSESHQVLEEGGELQGKPEVSRTYETTTKPPPSPLPKNATYLAASYVKFLEAGGARVVPIFINRDRAYYEKLLNSINGVLFPGGAVAIDESSGYGRAGKLIYEIAKDMNDAGQIFPLWGTCLGFELMMVLGANGQEIRVDCDAQNTANRIKLDAAYDDGYLMRHLPKRLIKALTSQRITGNFHSYCVTPKNFVDFGVNKVYRPLAYSADRRGVEYIALAEALEYPFFATQEAGVRNLWRTPVSSYEGDLRNIVKEKNPYEWTNKPGHNNIPHSSIAIDASNHFAQMFVDYAKRSKHRFANEEDEMGSLIYNYSPLFTGQHSLFEQIYVF